MATHDIARETWAAFFDDFSSRHQNGARVSVSSVSPQSARGPRVEQDHQPFSGIALNADVIRLQMGEDHTHVIERPTRVYHKTGPDVLMSSEVEHGEAIEITASGGPPITYLRFFRPTAAEDAA